MPPAQRGTGWTNLQQYLGLNRGAAQGMADTLAGDATAAGQAYTGALQTAGNNLYNQLGAASQKMTPQGSMTSTEAQRLAGQQWTGPAGFDTATVTDLTGKAAAAQNKANALGSNEGRQTLLGKLYGPNTWGGGALDAALAGAGDTKGSMGQAQGAYGRLLESLGQSVQNAQGEATKYREDFEKGRDYYASQVPGLQQQESLARRQQQVNRSAPLRAELGRGPGRGVSTGKGGKRDRPGFEYNYP